MSAGSGGTGLRLLAIPVVATLLSGCAAGDGSEQVHATVEAGATAGSPTAGRPVPLARTAAVRSLESGACHHYMVAMERDQVLELLVEQDGIDVVVRVTAPGGEVLELDSPVGRTGPDGGILVASSEGAHRVDVCAPESPDLEGSYRLRRAALRPAREADRRLDAGYRRYGEGRRLAAEDLRTEARVALEGALRIFEETGDLERQSWAWYKIGRVAIDADDAEGAIAAFRAAATLSREVHRPALEAKALQYVGFLSSNRGDLDAALAAYERAYRVANGGGLEELAAAARPWIAVVNARMGRTLDSLGQLEELRELNRGAGEAAGEVEALLLTARQYQIAGTPRAAMQAIGQALRVAEREGLRHEQGRCLAALGSTHLDVDHALLAQAFLERALDLLPEDAAGKERAQVLLDLGRAYRRLGEHEAARDAFEEVIERAPNELVEVNARINFAHLHDDLGAHEAGFRECRAALDGARRLRDLPHVASALQCMAENRAAQGRYAEALELSRAALRQVEETRSGYLQDDLRATFLASKHRYYELQVRLLLDLHRRLGDPAYAAEAFEVAERSKARTLLDGLERGEPHLEETGRPALVARRRTLERQLSELENRLLQVDPGDAAAERALAERLDQLRADHARVRAEIVADRSGWRRASGLEPLSLGAVRSALLDAGDTQIVSYFLGEEESAVWVVSRDSLEVRRLPGRARLDALADSAADLLARSHQVHQTVQASLVARELARTVLAPVADLLSARRLVLIKEGALHRVPFAALPVPGSDGTEWLVDRHVLIGVPSASTAAALRRNPEDRGAEPRGVAIYADPVFAAEDPRLARATGGGRTSVGAGGAVPAESAASQAGERFPRLEATRGEAAAIAELVVPDRLLLRLGFDASLHGLREEMLRELRILHFATHGVVEADRSGLVLSLRDASRRPVDGFLSEWAVYDLDLAADLVVLSACRSGLGERLPGEGVLGLARAFLWAGSSNVLASLWDVDDRATAALISHFYRALLDAGATPAEALQSAQIAVRDTPRWAAPHYWAGFVLQGDPR